jgi:hypothetical protein
VAALAVAALAVAARSARTLVDQPEADTSHLRHGSI